jgi:hypothetical protein
MTGVPQSTAPRNTLEDGGSLVQTAALVIPQVSITVIGHLHRLNKKITATKLVDFHKPFEKKTYSGVSFLQTVESRAYTLNYVTLREI